MLWLSLTLAVLLAIPAEWAIVGACLGLAAAVFLFIFYIQPDASDLAPHRSKLDQLLERRDTIYDNLRDLKFEYRAGKYSEGDYETMRVTLENEALARPPRTLPRQAGGALDEGFLAASSYFRSHRTFRRLRIARRNRSWLGRQSHYRQTDS
jgi:hypothetical protein